MYNGQTNPGMGSRHDGYLVLVFGVFKCGHMRVCVYVCVFSLFDLIGKYVNGL